MTATADATRASPLGSGFIREFKAFLDNYGVIGVAIAFIIGQAMTELVKVVVAGLVMPLINPLLRLMGDDWRAAEYTAPGGVGPFLVGQLTYAIIYFLVIALFVFAVAKLVLRQQSVKKI